MVVASYAKAVTGCARRRAQCPFAGRGRAGGGRGSGAAARRAGAGVTVIAAAAAHFGRDLDFCLRRVATLIEHAGRAGAEALVLPDAALDGPRATDPAAAAGDPGVRVTYGSGFSR